MIGLNQPLTLKWKGGQPNFQVLHRKWTPGNGNPPGKAEQEGDLGR